MNFPVIFTDLDGTLLDFTTYSPEIARPNVYKLRQKKVPIIFCSSKTRREQEIYRTELGIPDPFIVENGSAIYIPRGYFNQPFSFQRHTESYTVIELGAPSLSLPRVLADVRAETGLAFDGYRDLTTDAVARLTGLSLPQAEAARAREYSETLVTSLSLPEIAPLNRALRARGYQLLSGGRFLTVSSLHTDKGRAIRMLTGLYRQERGQVTTVGIGDSENDAALFEAVDYPYQVQTADGGWAFLPDVPVTKVPAIGPAGWNWAAEKILSA